MSQETFVKSMGTIFVQHIEEHRPANSATLQGEFESFAANFGPALKAPLADFVSRELDKPDTRWMADLLRTAIQPARSASIEAEVLPILKDIKTVNEKIKDKANKSGIFVVFKGLELNQVPAKLAAGESVEMGTWVYHRTSAFWIGLAALAGSYPVLDGHPMGSVQMGPLTKISTPAELKRAWDAAQLAG
jgi:hypothetical protein